MLMFGDAMSIFARSTCAPSANSPARMRAEQVQVLVDRPRRGTGCPAPGSVSVPRCARISSAVRLSTYALPSADQLYGALVELLEVVRRVEEPVVPGEAEPADVGLDRLDVLDVLVDRVRVVEAQVAGAAEVLRDAEVEADRLGVADVQVAVGLGRETRGDTAARACRSRCRPR